MIILFMMYRSNYGIFSYCVPFQPACTPSEYIDNPTNALRNGYNLNDILYIGSGSTENVMYYKRPINTPCSPGDNQVITINYPQYCNFIDDTGNKVLFRDIFYNANRYRIADDSDETLILTNMNCDPASEYQSGEIVLRWDS